MENKGYKTLINIGLQNLSLGRSKIESIDSSNKMLHLKWPLTLGFSKLSKEFDGRSLRVIGSENRKAHIVTFEGQKKLKVSDSSVFKPTDWVDVRTIKEGDMLTIPSFVHLKKDENDQWEVESNQNIHLELCN